MLNIFKEVFNHFFNSNTFQKGASLAYYAVFSLLPMIMIVTSVMGVFFGPEAVTGELFEKMKDLLGTNAAQQIQDVIKNQHLSHSNILTAAIGLVTLIFSASGMFNQIHNSFNGIWNIKSKPKSSVLRYLTKHLTSFLVLIVLFFILFASTAINGFLRMHSDVLSSDLRLYFVYEHLLSYVVISLAFAFMFKFLGDAKVYWKIAFLGGCFTSLLFIVGKIGIGMYIEHSHIKTTFGSASAFVLVMLWVYYSSQIIFLGASFVKVIGTKLGLEIVPNQNAVKIESREIKPS